MINREENLEIFFDRFNIFATICYALFHLTRIPRISTHRVPWSKPFVSAGVKVCSSHQTLLILSCLVPSYNHIIALFL